MENIEKQVKDNTSWGSEYIKDLGDKTQTKASELGDKVQAKANEYGDKIREAGNRVANSSAPTIEDARKMYEEGKSQAYDFANSLGKRVSATARENPILVSVASLAVGYGIATWLFKRRKS